MNISKKKNNGKHLVQLWINEDKYQQVKRAADSVEEPVTTWIRRAVFQAVRRWDAPKPKKSMIPPCPQCGKNHDPQEHFPRDEE